jgi:multidrug efflux system outer membrane protein
VQTAFREVADALSVRASLAERLAAQRALVASAERQLTLANALHRAGSTGMLEVLDAQRSLYSAQQSLIDLRLTEQSNRLELYKVLGGGWKS